MFSRARRQSKVQQARASGAPEPAPNVPSPLPLSANISVRSDSPALPSPAFSSFDVVRPSSSDSAHLAAHRKSRLAFGPPVLPPIPRVASTRDGTAPHRTDSAPDLPILSVRSETDNVSIASRKSGIRLQRSFDHSAAAGSGFASNTHALVPLQNNAQTALMERDGNKDSPHVTNAGHHFDGGNARSTPAFSDQQTHAMDSFVFPPPSGNILDINFDSPVMEASMFPSFSSPQSVPVLPAPPTMNRSFIDSRDRPYSQPKLRSPPVSQYEPISQSPFAQHYVLPTPPPPASPQSQKLPRTPTSIGTVSMTPSEPTIGLPFESTSIKHPLPKLVERRPKNTGTISKIAGVDVPTHHTSSIKSNKSDRQKRKSLNPVSLFGRRKSTGGPAAPVDIEKKAPAVPTGRQKAVASVGVPKIPDDFDPRIRGKIVHDFSAPRRSTMSPIEANFPNGITFDSPVSQARQSRHLSAQHHPQGRPISRSPVFVENFTLDDRPSPIDRSSGGIGAEHRENKQFLARFSQQSSTSTFSQESAILPPFARKSQILDQANSTLWREDEGSWSSGRDSGGNSSAAPGDRESGLSSFSIVSPITGRSSGSNQSNNNNGLPTASSANMLGIGNLSPVSPHFEHRFDPLERPISMASIVSDKLRPRGPSEATARPEIDTTVHHVDTNEPLDARSMLPSQAQAGAEIDSPEQRLHANSRRFSFQSGINGNEEEMALEKTANARDTVMPLPKQTEDLDDEEDFEYFDENAIDDLDELELENQEPMPSMVLLPKAPLVEEPPAAKEPVEVIQKSSPKVRRANSDDFFYEGHIPYQSNERELTYAEHPVFQTHSALVDSRRTSYQSTFLDSYLASSPTSSSPRRHDEGSERRGSTPSILTSKTGRDRSTSGSSAPASTRGNSTQATSATFMSPLHESDEPAAGQQDPATPVTNGDFAGFHFSNSPGKQESPVARTDSDAEPPKWSRTANLWKQYSTEPSSRASTPGPPSAATSHASERGLDSKAVRVRKPTGAMRQVRNSVVSQRMSVTPTSERLPPRAVRAIRGDRTSTRSPMLNIPRGPSALSGESRPTSKLSIASSQNTAPLVPHNTVAKSAIGVAKSEHHSTGEPHVRLEAYHQALADAANDAAAAGRFSRKPSTATVDTAILNQPIAEHHVAAERGAPQPEPTDVAPRPAAKTASNMAFDFGFNDSGMSEPGWGDSHEDDDMVAAANADALANDNDGFYGSEFGFYARANPGKVQNVEATDGGYFGEDGDDGLARQRSLKEPNLTPITERSEFSTRNSFVGLGGFATPTTTTPTLARMPISELNEGDILSFEQLKRLRHNTFGGSTASLSSSQARGSPTSPHFDSSIAASSDSTGSVDSRHQSALMEDLNHNAALVQQSLSAHKSSPLISH